MATLVLTTVGTALGGPIGGAIGAAIGSQVDQRLFAPRRQGARLGALAVQTSAYGQPLPKLFGTMRVAGTVIWATDLREERDRSGGGKGRPKVTTYSYSASFAVALSGRPIRAVRRIWADGKLLRGAAGDWKSETGFRLHSGDEAQDVDPLIAAAEGAEGTPAYRGIAYAVFEDMQLADFGNRIPSLTFEVEADEAPVSLGRIALELSGGVIGDETFTTLGGYAAGGDSVRGAIEGLARVLPLAMRDDGSRLVLTDGLAGAIEVNGAVLGAHAGAARGDRLMIERQAAGTLPDEVTLTYHEQARDYQAGLQRARRGGPGRRVEAIELPAVLSAAEAKAAAERRLAESWAARLSATASVPWRWLTLRAGDAITIDGGPRWRIGAWTLEGMVLTLKLRAAAGATPLPVAQPGRATAGLDAQHGPTTIVLLDLPPIDDGATTPRLWLAAAGTSPGWRRAAVIASQDGGTSWRNAGGTAAPATMGRMLGRLAGGASDSFDMISAVEVELLNDMMTLISRDDDALGAGANLAMIGDEMVQFGRATFLGDRRWKLTRLLRGRRGSEAAMTRHGDGEAFVLVEADSLLPIESTMDRIGSELRVIASGVGDTVGVTAAAIVTGRSLRPPSPVHLHATPLAGGGLRFGWTRRSRVGWAWSDGGDAPLAEETERYRITVTPASGRARTAEAIAPVYDYSAGDLAADGAGAATSFAVVVSQLGNAGESLPAAGYFAADGDVL